MRGQQLLLLRLLALTVGFVGGFQLPGLPASKTPTTAQSSVQPQQQPQPQPPRQGSYSKTNPVLKAAVGLLTNGLNGAVGAREDESTLAQGARARARGSITPRALLAKIREDYEARAYFLTGDISAAAYDEDCVFTDPTISFAGLATWTRNIAALKLFFREPKLELRAIDLNTATRTVETQWRLTCELALPWRPFIDVEGSTVHRYDPTRGGRVVEHVESWEVSALDAVLQLFRPGGKTRPSSETTIPTDKKAAATPPSALAKAKASFKLLAGLAIPMLSSFSSSSLVSPGSSALVARAAEDRRQVADIPASGIIFKDSINVEAFRDPKVEGVTIYISDFRRPLAERLAKDFFSDPAQASVACVRTGPVTMRKIDMSKAGEEVFSEARSLLFKTIRVRRIYDKESKAILYISYSTRLSKTDDDNKSRFKSSLCAVPLDGESLEIIP